MSQAWPELATDENIGLPGGIATLKDLRELLESEAHSYAHVDMARATRLRLVMRHFAPLPTSETRR